MYNFHLLKLPTTLQAHSFEQFARDRYLPALHTGPTRVRQLLAARMLRREEASVGGGDPPDFDRHFLLMTEWGGLKASIMPRIEDPGVERLFEAYGPRIEPLGHFETIAELQRS